MVTCSVSAGALAWATGTPGDKPGTTGYCPYVVDAAPEPLLLRPWSWPGALVGLGAGAALGWPGGAGSPLGGLTGGRFILDGGRVVAGRWDHAGPLLTNATTSIFKKMRENLMGKMCCRSSPW